MKLLIKNKFEDIFVILLNLDFIVNTSHILKEKKITIYFFFSTKHITIVERNILPLSKFFEFVLHAICLI